MSGRKKLTPPRARRTVLAWNEVMEAHQESERRLIRLLRMQLPDDAKQLVNDLACDVTPPILRRDGRKLAGRWESRPGFLWQQPKPPVTPGTG